ncbi:MAG: aminotransferase class I/II-fold pyridoxal phosphate-dependent enzyme [Planctomycetaceae bacterium]|jgi:aspartate/methionine/tyrosine aminotransferase|nr:aminotransferase class I/II-fold pyridoxal phosphate-dependent enzyme [Planctomycetaceae bacterium]
MKIEPFLTEQFFTQYEFSAPHLLASSDCETMSIGDLLQLAGSTLDELGGITLGYTESQGDPQLRSQISGMYTDVDADDVVILTSPVEGIYLAMQTLLEPDDKVVALRPAYDALNNVARHLCGEVIPWNLVARANQWELDFDQLESIISPQTRMIVVNFPHNPTGFVPSTAEFERLITLARENNAWLFCDEIYRGLEFDTPMPSAADRYEKSIVLGGLSKTYGLPGLRAGWLVIRNPALRDELINWKHYTTICPAAPTEFLARKALSVRKQLAERSKTIIQGNLKLCDDFFARFPDHFTWRSPRAGSVAFVELNLAKIGFDSATTYCHHLAQNHGIVLLPGKCLGFDDSFVRFGLGRVSFGTALDAYTAVVSEENSMMNGFL